MKKRHIALLMLMFAAGLARAEDGAPDLRRNTNTVVPDDTATWTGRMQRQVDSLINLPMFETSQLGLYVRDLTEGRDLVCVNHRQRMRPASCQKVVTAIGALRHLGGDYKLRTRLMVTGEVRDSVLWGDVCLVGGMDPLLAQGEVFQMARALREAGIDSLAGVIRLDMDMKGQDERGWGWCWDDRTVPLRPLTVDRKDRFTTEWLTDLQLAGVRGGDIGRVVQAACPPEARLFCEVTHTIDQVLERTMKRSDNFFAECLFYQLAALSGHRPAGRSDAVAYIDMLISEVGLNPAHYQVADGSGLSLYNYLSAEALTMLLRYAWFDNRIYSHLLPTLPVAAQDGTLKKRFVGTPAASNVQAKTGTLTGITSLAGYCTAPDDHRLCFAVIVQGVMHASEGRDLIDRLCVELCR